MGILICTFSDPEKARAEMRRAARANFAAAEQFYAKTNDPAGLARYIEYAWGKDGEQTSDSD
jgi:hypothetical protein